MKRKETNKIIAEFMGAYKDDKGYWGFTNTKERHRWHTDRFLDATHYDTDWNWLMEVVEKCFKIEANYGLHKNIEDALIFNSETRIYDVYNAVVKFIEVYNSAKNN